MRKFLIGLAIVIVLLIVAAAVVPRFIDLDSYRGQIASRVEALTGRKLTIGGHVSFALLPTPRLSVADVQLANPPGASSPDLLALKSLEVRVALFPLFGGRIEVESLHLIQPVIDLEVLADGSNTWDFASPGSASGPGKSSPGVSSPGGGNAAAGLSLQDVVIEDGTLLYRDARSGQSERLDRIEATLGAGSLQGPFTAKGALRFRNHALTFAADLGTLGDKVPALIDVTLGLEPGGAAAHFTGTLTGVLGGATPSALGVEGKLHVAVQDAAALETSFKPGASALPAGPVTLDGKVNFANNVLTLGDLALDGWGSSAHGNLQARLGAAPRVDLKLAVNLLDLDRLLKSTGAAPEAKPAAVKDAAPRRSATPAKPSAALPSFTLPAGWSGSLDLSAEAIVWHGRPLRQVALKAGLANGTLTLNQARVLLPGASAVELSGSLATPGGHPRFDGRLTASADSLRTLLSWLGADVARVPADRLLRARLTTGLALEGQVLRLSPLALTLDSSQVKGTAALTFGARPSLDANLDLDRISLDAYLPQAAASHPAKSKSSSATPAPAAAARAAAGPGMIPARLALKIGELTFRGTPIRGIAAVADLAGDRLQIEKLTVADAAQAALSLQGRVASFNRAPRVDLDLSLKTSDPAGLFRLAGLTPSPALSRLKPVDLAFHVAGGGQSWTLSNLRGSIAGTTFKGGATAALGGTRPKLTLDLQAGTLDLDRLLGTSAAPARAPGRTRPASVPVAPAASSGRWSTAPLDLKVLRSFDAEAVLSASRLLVDGYDIGTPKASATLNDGTLTLHQVSGQIFGGTFNLQGNVAGAAAAKAALTFSLKNGDLAQALKKLAASDRISGRFSIDGAIAAEGASQRTLVQSLSGKVSWTAADGVIRGINLKGLGDGLSHLHGIGTVAELLGSTLSGGTTKLIQGGGSFAIQRGIATTSDSQAKLEGGDAKLTGQIDLPDWTMDLLASLHLSAPPDAPGLAIALKGPIDQPRRDVKAAAVERYLLQRAGSKFLGKGAGGAVLQQLLGGSSQGSAPGASSPAPAPAKPADQIKNLLKGLLR